MDYFKVLLIFLIALPAQVFADISSGNGGYISQGVPNSEITLTAEERVFLNSHDLRCAMAPNWSPINMYDQNKQLVGIAIDYWKLISKQLYINVDCDVKESYNEVLQAIETRDADFMLATSMTDDRKRYADFSKAYVSFPIAIATTVDTAYLADETALIGKRVAVGRGYSAQQILMKDNPAIEFVEVANTGVGLQMLAANQVFAVVDSLPVLQQLIKAGKHNTIKIAGTTRYDIDLRLMVRGDYPQLAVIFNKAIDMISEQEHKTILSRWLDLRSINDQSIVFTPAEQAWISENHPIRVGFWKHAPIFYLKDGKVVGIAVDLLNKISADTGLSFQYENRLDRFADVLKGLKDQNGPDFVGALMPTAEREKDILFTKPYFSSPRFIFTRDDAPFISSIENLKGKTVAVVKDYVIHHALVEKYSDIDLLIFHDSEEALRAVSSGKAFAFIGDLVATPAMINEFGLNNIKAACPSGLPDHPLAMGIRNDWPELRNIIDKALDAMPAYEKAAILNKWNSVQFDYGISPHDVKKWVLIFGSSVISIFFLVVFWNRSLARRVKERTITLSESEEALRVSELRFRATFEQAAVGVALVDADGDFLRLNQKFCDITGYSREEMLALTFQDITYAEDLDKDLEYLREVLAGNKNTYAMEKRYICKDSSIVWINLTVAAVRKENGEVDWLVSVIEDISQRKLAEEALRLSEGRLSEAQRIAHLGHWDWDLVNGDLWWSEEVYRIYGLVPYELSATYELFSSFLHPDDVAFVALSIDEAISGHELYDIEHRIVLADGTERFVHGQGGATYNAAGKAVRMQGTLQDITESKLAEEALRQSRDYLQFLTDSLADAVFSVKLPERTIEWVNDSYQVLGYTQEECIGESTEKFYSDPDAYPKLGALMAEAIKSGQQIVSFEAMLCRSNGEIIPAEVRTTFYKEYGQVVSATSVVRNITERRRAAENEDRLRLATAAARVAIWDFDPRSNAVFLSPEWKQQLGYEDDELESRIEEWDSRLHPDDREEALGMVEDYLVGRIPEYAMELRLRHKDGSYRWIYTRGEKQLDDAGNPVRILGCHVDITEQKQGKALLEESEFKFRALVEQASVGIEIYALDGKFITGNAAFAKLYALSEETLDLVYEKYNVLQDEQLKTLGLMPQIEQTFNGENVVFPPYEYDVVETLKTLDVDHHVSRKCWLQSRGFALKDKEGKMNSIVFMSADITERMQAEKALLDYQLRLKSLTAEAVRTEDRERRKIATELHDHVGQSLAVMRIQLASAIKEANGRKLESILHEVSSSLLQAVKDTRNIITDLSPPTLNELGLGAAIMEFLNEQIETRYGLQVQFTEEAEPVLLNDETRAILYRSVRELLMNVVKHASAHSVSVSITRHQDGLQVVVEDDGIGLLNGQVPKPKFDEGGYGLFSIEERMKDIGGSLRLEQDSGKGLKAILITPLDN